MPPKKSADKDPTTSRIGKGSEDGKSSKNSKNSKNSKKTVAKSKGGTKSISEPKPNSELKPKVKSVPKPKAKTDPKTRAIPKNDIQTTPEHQTIKIEIGGVKLELALKEGAGLEDAKIVKSVPTRKPVNKKKTIPKKVRDDAWNHWIGKDKGTSKCLCCEINEISQNDFHCGHIIAESKGGATTVQNLKPICGGCNRSMASKNLDEFKNEHYPSGGGSLKKRVLPKNKKCDLSNQIQNKRIKKLITDGFISKTSGEVIMRRLCTVCSNYYHDPFNNLACPCRQCDDCNEKQKASLYTPYSDFVCTHFTC